MIPSNVVQASLVGILKLQTTLPSLLVSLGGDGAIREYQYQSDTFQYPALRVELHNQTPIVDDIACNKSNQRFSLLIFDEQKSSKNANLIAGAASAALHRHQYSYYGVKFAYLHVDSIIPAIRKDEASWRAEVTLNSLIYLLSGTYS